MVLGVVKSNLAIKPAPSDLVAGRGRTHRLARRLRAERGGPASNAAKASPRADAEGFLHELLSKGAMASSEVEDSGQSRRHLLADLAPSRRCHRRAKVERTRREWAVVLAPAGWAAHHRRTTALTRSLGASIRMRRGTWPTLESQTWTSWTSSR